LHEAAHAIADRRGIKTTSRQGRYHNARFKVLAEEVGLEVRRDPTIGWSPNTLASPTAADYRKTLGELAQALAHRKPEKCPPEFRWAPYGVRLRALGSQRAAQHLQAPRGDLRRVREQSGRAATLSGRSERVAT